MRHPSGGALRFETLSGGDLSSFYAWIYKLRLEAVGRRRIALTDRLLVLRYLAFSLILSCAHPALVCADSVYLQELIQQARDERLAEWAQWRALLHYQASVFGGGVRSLADAPSFFNAADGKTNPQAELEATLASFFSDIQETDQQQNPQCAFIARYQWLKQALEFDPARLPEQPCPRFNAWRRALNAKELTLIFPAAYLNNPASMFGHTLLRVDAEDQDEHSRLLAYAINYAAATDEANGVAFAVKGLLGGYPGVFSISPYYAKVKEYSDIENRDIWEYRLDFTQQEIDRMLMHAWELGRVHFDYYFLDENCSYHLLSLFEVAQPGLRLTERFRWWAIPADTVRLVAEQPGLLKDVVYRPARSTILRHRLSEADAHERSLAKQFAEGTLVPTDPLLSTLSVADRARVLELAFEYLNYAGLIRPEVPRHAARTAIQLLKARSELETAQQASRIPEPAVRPDQGHNTARLALGYGQKDGSDFVELGLRPAYHDLLDPEGGYVRGAQIDFLALRLRYYMGEDSVRLENASVIDIASLAPRNPFIKPISWRVHVGAGRKRFSQDNDALVGRLMGGIGLTYEPVGRTLVAGFLDGALEVSGQFEGDYALGAGPGVDIATDVSERWRINLSARSLFLFAGDDHTAYELTLGQRVRLSKQSALRVEISRKSEFDNAWTSGQVAWQLYF